MSDLIERLRIYANEPIGAPRTPQDRLCDEAADEIERLRLAYAHCDQTRQEEFVENERLRGLLREAEEREMNLRCQVCGSVHFVALPSAVDRTTDQPSAAASTNSPEVSSGLVPADNQPATTSPASSSSTPPLRD